MIEIRYESRAIYLYLESEQVRVYPRPFRAPLQDLKKCETIRELEAWEYKYACAFAVRSLAKKDQPSTEIRQKLKRKGIGEIAIDKLIETFSDMGYLDDRAWVERSIEKERRKGLGEGVIRSKLLSKGVSSEIVQQLMSETANPDAERGRMETLIAKKFKNKDLNDPKEKNKAIQFLLRKGYSYDVITSYF